MRRGLVLQTEQRMELVGYHACQKRVKSKKLILLQGNFLVEGRIIANGFCQNRCFFEEIIIISLH